ncbi:fibronectin type III domain-containing protein [Candidatus Desantisbacteria bacterium]|nr:fibronectin type III domain-containing protein [Candidatus Desantisbacteria bacterium]
MTKKCLFLFLSVMLISIALACGDNTKNNITTNVPAVPTNVNAVAGDGQITISWNSVSDATSYNIYWSTNTGVSKSNSKISGLPSPYTHTALTNGITYYYVVTAVNSAGESNVSTEVSAKPVAVSKIPNIPSNVSAASGDGQITISWNSVSDATSYNIYWSTNTGVSKSDNKIAMASIPYIHTNLSNGIIYYYVITSVNSTGESDISIEASAKPLSTAIAAGKWDEMKWDNGIWGE